MDTTEATPTDTGVEEGDSTSQTRHPVQSSVDDTTNDNENDDQENPPNQEEHRKQHDQQQRQQPLSESDNDDARWEKDVHAIREANWKGCIPVVVTLCPTSNSSTSTPPVVHLLVNRQTFLHIGLEPAVRRLQEYGPPTLSFMTGPGTGGDGTAGTGSRTGTTGNNKVLVVEEPESTLDMEFDKDRMSSTVKRHSDDKHTKNDNANDNKESADHKNDDGDDNASSSSNSSNEGHALKSNLPYPKCWFEDEERGIPLRWQYFVGVLFDSILQPSHSVPSIPWRIRLHFQNFPSTLLDLDDGSLGNTNSGILTTIERTYFNSLKQSLVLQHGHARVALNLTKQSHQTIWNSICTSNFQTYQSIANDIQAKPARNNSQPPGKKETQSSSQDSGGDDVDQSSAEIQSSASLPAKNTPPKPTMMTIPVRLSVEPTQPMIQRRCEYHHPDTNNLDGPQGSSDSSDRNPKQLHKLPQQPTLGSLLSDWAPQYFTFQDDYTESNQDDETNQVGTDNKTKVGTSAAVVTTKRQEDGKTVSWLVAGVTPPLSTPLIDLWDTLSCPDQFLYISIVRQRKSDDI